MQQPLIKVYYHAKFQLSSLTRSRDIEFFINSGKMHSGSKKIFGSFSSPRVHGITQKNSDRFDHSKWKILQHGSRVKNWLTLFNKMGMNNMPEFFIVQKGRRSLLAFQCPFCVQLRAHHSEKVHKKMVLEKCVISVLQMHFF